MTSKHVNDMTDEEVADRFIHHGGNQTHAAVYAVFMQAAMLQEPLTETLTARHEFQGLEHAVFFVQATHERLVRAMGMRVLLDAVVKRFAFASPFSEDDFDPYGERSADVAELILQHAIEANKKTAGQDESK